MIDNLSPGSKKAVKETIKLKNPRVIEVLNRINLSKSFDNMVMMDTAIDLADEMHIKPEEAFAILIGITRVIRKRTIQCKPTHLSQILTLMPYYNTIIREYRLKVKMNKKFRREIINEMTLSKIGMGLNQEEIKKDINNRISTKTQMRELLAIIFGFKK